MDGFDRFCIEHIIMLVFIFSAAAAGTGMLKRASDKTALTVIRIASAALFAGEFIQDILLIRDGGELMDFLPLHLCNLGIFVNLAASFTKGKIRAFLAEVSLVLIMPGAVGALIIPTWNYKPFWSYLPLLCFFTHALLVFIPLVFFVRGMAGPSFRHFHYPFIFLAVIVPPIWIFDKCFGCNYMFLISPVDGSVLQTVHNITGDPFYIAGLLVMVSLILLTEYLIFYIFRKITSSD